MRANPGARSVEIIRLNSRPRNSTVSSLKRPEKAGFQAEGVPFTLLFTISDPKRGAPVREEMRLDLQNRGLILSDITLAHRIRPRFS
jgi:hypothetical protein